MKICLLSEYFYPDNMGSTGTVLSNLCRYLKDNYQDVDIDVITSKNLYRGGECCIPKEDWNGIRITRINCPPTKQESTVKRLLYGILFTKLAFWKLLFRTKYDIVFVVTNPPMLAEAAWWTKLFKHTPFVYLIHDLHPDVPVRLGSLPADGLIAGLSRLIQNKWLHAADRVVVLGRCMKKYLGKAYHLPESRIEVITNWSDPDTVTPTDTNTKFRKENTLDGFVILYAGNLGKFQNFDDLLDAASTLSKIHPDITFAFVGEGAKKDYIRTRAEEMKLDNIRMFTHVPPEDLGDLLCSADVSIISLEPGMEGLGVPSKMYNILASGRPIVALLSKDSEVAMVLDEAKCGIQVDHGNPSALVDAFSRLYEDETLRSDMGKNARSIFLEKYILPKIAEQYHETFLSILKANDNIA
ncbi:glycosyltransferase family 4 protein [uncultured Desulfobulbus sp.]|uniref:glycosyltransferase family 4 protein n=1 Tax=uncultured Desulfobulbus sp. TaxID=239745 RepID=UPI0029C7D7EE|nr:glycosyltransferase family 4 protein [uncultured Desulfobulbus sp.]